MQFVSPNCRSTSSAPSLALFVQDQFRLKRITISAGLRFDWLRESVAASSVPAGALVPPQSFPAIKNVPNWKDVSPRLGV